jgi:outer membrane protein assembly factor BamB
MIVSMPILGFVGRVLRSAVWVLVGAGLVVFGWIWLIADRSGQEKMMMTVPLLLALGVLAVVGLVTVRGPWRRIARSIAAVLVAVGLAVPVMFRLKGLTGDFFPVLEYRFAPKHDTTLPGLPGETTAPEPTPTDAITMARRHEGTKDDSGVLEPDTSAPASAEATAGKPSTAPGTPAPSTAPGTPAPGTSAPASAEATAGRHVSFPQFLGPTRTGVIPDVRLVRDWVAHPPKQIWRIPVGAGWSGFAIDRGLAITQEQRAGNEMVVAYDLMTGAPRWSHGDAVRYDSVIAGDGPRATPTISGAHVATLGSTGRLNVLDFRTGRRLWSKDIAADNQATSPEWGRSGSPLILDGKVIVSAGGGDGRSLVAYDARTGARVWSGGSDDSGYASPIVMNLLGRPQVVILNRVTLAGHDPATGAMLWSQPWVSQPNVAMPIRVADDLVLGSTGYGIGSKLVKLTSGADGAITPAFVWETPRLKAKFTNPVLHGGFVYGLDDGVLVCMDVTTGERRWRAGRYGHGQTLLVGDVLLVTTEDGEIVLVEPTPEAHRELARFTAFEGKTWNPPAIAGKYLLVRSDKEAALYELTLRASETDAATLRD